VYRALWQVFGIPGDRAEDGDPVWLRRLQVLAMAEQEEGGEQG
jgi:hypothetical protein